MKKLLFLLLFPALLNAQTVMAWYAGWMDDYLTPEKIDYGAVTHILHAFVEPTTTGGLSANGVEPTNKTQISRAVNAAHAGGKKILISVGGWWCRDKFEGAMRPAYRTTFVRNLMGFARGNGYDGIDIDMEDIWPENRDAYHAFITELRDSIDRYHPDWILTCAIGWTPEIFAEIHEKFDQLNLMTYDQSGAWGDWPVWHNSPLYNGDQVFPKLPWQEVPCADNLVQELHSLGVPMNKIGIGADFYGYVWKGGAGTPTGGVTEPMQSYTEGSVDVTSNVSYFDIMRQYYQPQYRKWDNIAKVPYLSIDNTGGTNDYFISYDDEQSITEKIRYVKEKGLGGLCIWELGGGYRPGFTPPDPLLQAVKTAMGGEIPPDTSQPPPPPPPPPVVLDSAAIYQLGYNDGYQKGQADVAIDSMALYRVAYDAGYWVGFSNGYNQGLTACIPETVFVAADTVYIPWDTRTFEYVNGQKFPAGEVVLPEGAVVIARNYNATTKIVTLFYLRPRQ